MIIEGREILKDYENHHKFSKTYRVYLRENGNFRNYDETNKYKDLIRSARKLPAQGGPNLTVTTFRTKPWGRKKKKKPKSAIKFQNQNKIQNKKEKWKKGSV